MVRQEKRQEREQHILDCAWRLVAEEGFLALRISDLAKAASVSVGTLYAHFESKEDLIIGMSMDSWDHKLSYAARILKLDLDAAERVMAVPIGFYLFDHHNPVCFEAQQLAGVPSIWRKASHRRHQSILNACREFESRLVPLIEEALRDGAFEARYEKQLMIDAIEFTQMSLAAGNAYISHVFLPESERDQMQRKQRQGMPHFVMSAFRGFGLQREDEIGLYQRLVDQCLSLSPKRLFPDCD